jgi:predicted CXXCH cytochrome family protein
LTKFRRCSNHPVLQGNLTCLDCHTFTRRRDYNLLYDFNRICQDCHPEQGGPYLYEHEAVNAYSVEGSGCVACHEPHGSENDRLLRQPGNQLCRQCHIEHITRNHGNAWEQVWSKYPCQYCHTETHGSFVSNLFLDPDLPAKFSGDCYNSGCHSLNK